MKKQILAIGFCVAILSCNKNQSHENSEALEENAEMTVSDQMVPEIDGKIFTTNASVQMQVKDAYLIGNEIQDDAIKNNGFIIRNTFNTQIIESNSVNISDDSIKKMDKVSKYNEIVVKVPAQNLRNHIKFALDQGIIINSIEINNDELTFEKYRNDLELSENTNAKISYKIEEKVTKSVINDKVKYATIDYSIKQEPVVISYNALRTDMEISRDINLGLEVKNALKDGWYYLKLILIFFSKLLPTLFTISVIVIIVIKVSKLISKSKIKKSN